LQQRAKMIEGETHRLITEVTGSKLCELSFCDALVMKGYPNSEEINVLTSGIHVSCSPSL
jgi:hypothetical protein